MPVGPTHGNGESPFWIEPIFSQREIDARAL